MNFQDKLLFWLLSTGISNEQGLALIEGDRRLKFSVKHEDPVGVMEDLNSALYSLGDAGREAIGLLGQTKEKLMFITFLNNK